MYLCHLLRNTSLDHFACKLTHGRSIVTVWMLRRGSTVYLVPSMMMLKRSYCIAITANSNSNILAILLAIFYSRQLHERREINVVLESENHSYTRTLYIAMAIAVFATGRESSTSLIQGHFFLIINSCVQV